MGQCVMVCSVQCDHDSDLRGFRPLITKQSLLLNPPVVKIEMTSSKTSEKVEHVHKQLPCG